MEDRTMKTKEFIERNLGGDKLVGRPIKLNQKTLIPNKDKYVEVVYTGDWHYGYPTCRVDKIKQQLEYCLKEGIYIVLMGDLLEAGLTNSVGDSVYHQRLNPQEQMEDVVELLQPMADAGLIIGIHSGNHEQRILKTTSINIAKIMARLLKVPYLGYACWHLWKVGDQNYTGYTAHGMSETKFYNSRKWLKCDFIAQGHTHSLEVKTKIYSEISLRNKTVEEKKCIMIITGSYLEYEHSYAQKAGFEPVKLGSPKAKLNSSNHNIHCSL